MARTQGGRRLTHAAMRPVRRRDLAALIAGAAMMWPARARAQQDIMPVIGFLHPGSVTPNLAMVTAFRRGLAEFGYVESHNVDLVFRWGFGRVDQMPMLEDYLVDRQVSVILAGDPSAATIKASQGIPLVFVTGGDPVKLGLVARLDRPGGAVTGVTFLASALGAKRLELLRAMVPQATLIALVASDTADIRRDRDALAADGPAPLVLTVATADQLDRAFATAADRHADAVMIASDPVMSAARDQLVALAQRYRLPTIYPLRAFVEAGGLMSYGANVPEAYHQAGIEVGRVLKGELPGDLPVQQTTQFELVINLKTAAALGLKPPPALLARADAVLG